MAGVQGSAMAVAVCNAGGLGSLPGAMLSADALGKELAAIQAQTSRPFNVNFFCHTPPASNAASALREAAWRTALDPYYKEFGIDAAAIPAGPGRAPFSAEYADVLAPFKPAVVSFHFGLPSALLLARVGAGAQKSFHQPRQLTKRCGWKRKGSMPSSPRASRPVGTGAFFCRTT